MSAALVGTILAAVVLLSVALLSYWLDVQNARGWREVRELERTRRPPD